MNFAQPWAWLWLLAVVPVIILYFLRRREKEWSVSALFLWEGIRPDQPLFLERLRQRLDLLLLLQILAVAFFSFSLSHPTVVVSRPSGATLLVLDGSAPAAARGMREKMLAAAREVLENSAGPWAVILWADPPALLCAPTSRPEEVLHGLSQYRANLARRPELAQALALLSEPWPRVVVITPDPPSVPGVEVVAVERPENLGITAFSVRPTPFGTGYEAYVRVFNGQKKYCDAQIRVRTEAGEFWASRLLPPEGEEDVIIPLSGLLAQTFAAELLPSDDFPWDNLRYFAFSGARLGVAWHGQEDRYLWAALRAVASVARTQANPDLTVAVAIDLGEEPLGPLLLWAAGSPACPRGNVREAGPLRAAPSPLLSHISLDRIRLTQVYEVGVPQEATVILWAGDLPLLAIWESPRGRRALFAGNLETSNLPILPDFPILVRNIFGWLVPPQPAPVLLVGQGVALPPDVQVVAGEEMFSGVWVPDQPGLYELRGPNRREYLAVNVPWEASLPPIPEVLPAVEARGAEMEKPLWPWILVLLGPLLFLEAFLYERRGGA